MRKRLLKSIQNYPSNSFRDRIENLNVEIKHHIQSQKMTAVQLKITPGNSKSLWFIFNIAKNVNYQKMPKQMFCDKRLIEKDSLPNDFATFLRTNSKTS